LTEGSPLDRIRSASFTAFRRSLSRQIKLPYGPIFYTSSFEISDIFFLFNCVLETRSKITYESFIIAHKYLKKVIKIKSVAAAKIANIRTMSSVPNIRTMSSVPKSKY
jgi:hypothetical protein